MFSAIYSRVMRWAVHPYAPRYLAGMSFAESSFFPIPPDMMLAPMALANPSKAWRYAGITTIASVIGGLFGYLIGHFLFELIEPMLHQAGYWSKYQEVRGWFAEWGFWAVFLAGFSPVPYKVFTIAAGVTGMPPLAFALASLISRGGRFYLVSALMVWGGARMERTLRLYIDRIGWVTVALAIIAYLVLNGTDV
ncbi:YqaA family protein [Thiohalomonas denitrificans]|uniref:Membrane protein YqaA, SNARE-associated domain n=1 Tax=Thiohalomonas denitrificans TaxID=415747 RepID=A0A1G5Q2I6_9GAMM|nr:YqaA family protein [Thiohalomonas denitrificans]SCZ56084.1 membrane protein YqaA, SNARE-associated domain [Thiohalomonas denitrificans]